MSYHARILLLQPKVNLSTSVVFSCWTKMMNEVQNDLENEGFNLERIDGKASLDQRRKAIHRFKEDPSCTIMLASIGSAGEGYVILLPHSVSWFT